MGPLDALNEMRRRVVLVTALPLALMVPAHAQPADSVQVPMSSQERAAVLNACEAALWANRQSFDRFCDFLRGKFEAAAKAAKAPTPETPPADQPQPKE